jgi:hypothetical protein
MSPIPDKFLFFCLLIFPRGWNPGKGFRAFQESLAVSDSRMKTDVRDWTAARSPRPYTFGSIQREAWQWHLVYDSGTIPDSSAQGMFGFGCSEHLYPEVRGHASHLLVFLTEAPVTNAVERVRETLRLAIAWFAGGASAIVFPSSGAVEVARRMKDFDPMAASPTQLVELLVRQTRLRGGSDQLTWFRTRGMGQIGLPEIAWGAPAECNADNIARGLEKVATFMIRLGQDAGVQEALKEPALAARLALPAEVDAAPSACKGPGPVVCLIST